MRDFTLANTAIQSLILNLSITMNPQIDTGDVAFMIQSSATVLFMTIPGLALYYGGMVRTKNILASVMQTLTIVCLTTFTWYHFDENWNTYFKLIKFVCRLCFGYSLAFAPSQSGQFRSDWAGDPASASNTNSVQTNPFLGDSSRFWLVGKRRLLNFLFKKKYC